PSDVADFDLAGALIHRELESEANRFAAEFLIPREFLLKTLNDAGSLKKAVELLQSFRISGIAASLKLIRSGPPGLIFAEMDENDRVLKSGKSYGTFFDCPTIGRSLDFEYYEKIEARVEIVKAWSFLVLIDARNARYSAPSS